MPAVLIWIDEDPASGYTCTDGDCGRAAFVLVIRPKDTQAGEWAGEAYCVKHEASAKGVKGADR